MNPATRKNIEKVSLKGDETILFALKQMDILERKLLIIIQEEKFIGLLSIGDIQRAIIKNLSLDTPVIKIIRDDIRITHVDDDMEKVKAEMLEYRIECMPIIDGENNLVDVLFWEDVFGTEENRIADKIDIPVVVMAGGEGTRLKPLTNIIPKPLLPIGEKTILENIMDRFITAGCNRFYLSVNYKAEMIQHYFSTLKNQPYQIEYFQEEKPLGTAGSLYLIKNKLNSTFFVSNCDIIIKQDLLELYNYHINNRNKITIVAALKHYKIPYGTIESGEQGILESLTEKPEITFKINSGVYLLEPETLSYIPQNSFFHITELINKIKEVNWKVGVFPISEKSWIDYGILENFPFFRQR
jgi:dTDP-glucose pyrophosphorylase/CBS domain-containing protein